MTKKKSKIRWQLRSVTLENEESFFEKSPVHDFKEAALFILLS